MQNTTASPWKADQREENYNTAQQGARLAMTASTPYRSVRAMERPLMLARALQAGPWADGISHRPARVDPRILGGAVPVVLDQVCDWWNAVDLVDGVGTPLSRAMGMSGVAVRPWPDPRLDWTAAGRLPWPKVWAEWVDGEAGREAVRVGCLMHEVPIGEAPAPTARGFGGADLIIAARVALQTESQTMPVRIFPPVMWGARADGSVLTTPDGLAKYACPASYGDAVAHFVWEILNVWRLFAALLQVRGTESVDTAIPRHVRRSWPRVVDGPPPWITYKTLQVRLPQQPNDDATRGARGSSSPPPGVPLHLVRAHIADYRRGRGLFGKYRQLVWVSAHTRGHARLGAIAKTYAASMAGAVPAATDGDSAPA